MLRASDADRERATAQVEPAASRWAVLRSLLASGGGEQAQDASV
jgi:hypothetical protein